ncbi:TPA: hypothetical protein HA246_03450 [Candidatus Woesearchaeota archaeon]|nr:hypothetical protein [Candidatus Woesearchaeota archaeon]
MGTPDSFNLLESIVCPNCIAKAEDTKIYPFANPKKGVGGVTIVNIGAHAGINDLQTHDLEDMCEEFRFPGLVAYDLRDGIIIPEPGEVNVLDMCSACDTRWEGTLALKHVKGTDKIATTKAVLSARIPNSVLPYLDQMTNHPLYTIEIEQEEDGNNQGRLTTVTIIPKLEECIKHHISVQKAYLQAIAATEGIYQELLRYVRSIDDRHNGYADRIEKKKQGLSGKLAVIRRQPSEDKNKWVYLDKVQRWRGSTWSYRNDVTNLCLALAYLCHEKDPEQARVYVANIHNANIQPNSEVDIRKEFSDGLGYMANFRSGKEKRRLAGNLFISFSGLDELFKLKIYSYKKPPFKKTPA